MHVYALTVRLPFDDSWNHFMSKNSNYTPAYLIMLSCYLLYADIPSYIRKAWTKALMGGTKLVVVFIVVFLLWYNQNRATGMAFMFFLPFLALDRLRFRYTRTALSLSVIVLVLLLLTYSCAPQLLISFPYMGDLIGQSSTRVGYIQTTTSLLSNSWPYGFGLGNWSIHFFNYDISSFSIGNYASSIDYSMNHSYINTLLGELGVVGVALFMVLILHPLSIAVWKFNRISSFQKASVFSLISYLIYSTFYASANFYTYHFSEITLLTMISLASISTSTAEIVMPKYVKTGSLLFSFSCLGWFCYAKIAFDKYYKLTNSDTLQNKELLFEELYQPIFLTMFYNIPIAHSIAKEYESKQNYHEANKWYEVALRDSPSSREALINSSRLNLRQFGYVRRARELAQRYYFIEHKNFDINLLLLEIAIYDGIYENVRAHRNAVLHGQYALRKNILELELYMTPYLLDVIHASTNVYEELFIVLAELRNENQKLLLCLAELENNKYGVEFSTFMRHQVNNIQSEYKSLLIDYLTPEQMKFFLKDQLKNSLEFRFGNKVAALKCSELKKSQLVQLLIDLKVNGEYVKLSKTEYNIDVCSNLYQTLKELKLRDRERESIQNLISYCSNK